MKNNYANYVRKNVYIGLCLISKKCITFLKVKIDNKYILAIGKQVAVTFWSGIVIPISG